MHLKDQHINDKIKATTPNITLKQPFVQRTALYALRKILSKGDRSAITQPHSSPKWQPQQWEAQLPPRLSSRVPAPKSAKDLDKVQRRRGGRDSPSQWLRSPLCKKKSRWGGWRTGSLILMKERPRLIKLPAWEGRLTINKRKSKMHMLIS